jgi:3-deoxy-7-phosphoheptulonate synthase
VEFFSGVHNPIGVKLGPAATPEDVVGLGERLNPLRVPGRLTFITRMGAGAVGDVLPPLLAAMREAEIPVVWSCDPMHANTFAAPSGHKTRRFDDVMTEIEGFFAAHRAVGTWPGGIHLEFTGENVTECLGGSEAVREEQLQHRYETLCDPRLNARQALDCAFLIAELMRNGS